MAAALTMKEALFCSNMMLELDFKEGFGSVPTYIGTSRRRQPHIQPSREAHRAEVLLCAVKLYLQFVIVSETNNI